MLFDFATVGIFLILAFLFVLAALITSRLVAPHNPEASKISTYECGESTIGDSWIKFNNRFYIIALAFLLFDVEIVFIIPCALIFKQYAGTVTGVFILVEILVFVAILIAGLAYMWVKGDLDWVKTTEAIFGEATNDGGETLEPGSGDLRNQPPEKECVVE